MPKIYTDVSVSNDASPPPTGLRVTMSPIAGKTPSSVLGNRIAFPAVLDSFEVSETASFGDYDSVGAGSFSVRRAGDDKAHELESFAIHVFAANDPNLPFTQNDAPTSWGELRARIKKVFRARFPVYIDAAVVKSYAAIGAVPIGGGRDVYVFEEFEDYHDFSGAATIRSFSARLDPGQPDVRYFSIECRSYRNIEEVEQNVRYGRKRGSGHFPHVHTVRAGDTLWKLAEQYYGQGSLYKIIQAQNQALRSIPASRPLTDYKKIKSVRIPAPPEKKAHKGRKRH